MLQILIINWRDLYVNDAGPQQLLEIVVPSEKEEDTCPETGHFSMLSLHEYSVIGDS